MEHIERPEVQRAISLALELFRHCKEYNLEGVIAGVPVGPVADLILAVINYNDMHNKVERTPDYMMCDLEQDGYQHANFLFPKEWTFVECCEKYPEPHNYIRQLHAAMGMAGEGGEVLDLFKKHLFGLRSPVQADVLRKEMGDLFWYFWLMCRAMGDPVQVLIRVLEENAAKLKERYDVT